jgi:hypothetical protein
MRPLLPNGAVVSQGSVKRWLFYVRNVLLISRVLKETDTCILHMYIRTTRIGDVSVAGA